MTIPTEISKEEVSSFIQEFLSVLSACAVESVSLIEGPARGSGFTKFVPFIICIPEKYKYSFSQFIEEISERCEYIEDTIQNLNIQDILIDFYKEVTADIIHKEDLHIISLYKRSNTPWEFPLLQISFFFYKGYLYGAVLPWALSVSYLDYYPENIIDDLIHSPYGSIIKSQVGGVYPGYIGIFQKGYPTETLGEWKCVLND